MSLFLCREACLFVKENSQLFCIFFPLSDLSPSNQRRTLTPILCKYSFGIGRETKKSRTDMIFD
jgi:hypothetical protein